MESLLVAVRQRTRRAHQRLEEALALVDRPLTMARYRLLLVAYTGFYDPLEARLAVFPQWLEVGIDYSRRRKLPWLKADLLALGETSGTLRSIRRCSDLPACDTFEQALGCAYVLEGATLGGRRLAGVVESQLGLSARHGARFFHSYGEALPAMWREFRSALLRAAETPEQYQQVLDAADYTFAAMHRWVCGTKGLTA